MKGKTKLKYIGKSTKADNKYNFEEVESEAPVCLIIYKTKVDILKAIKPGQVAWALVNEGFLNEWDILEDVTEDDRAEGEKQLELNYKKQQTETILKEMKEDTQTTAPGPSPKVEEETEVEVEEVEEIVKDKKKVDYKTLTLRKKLQLIQSVIKVPKGHKSFNYNYRNTSDILQKLKPLMKKLEVFITLSDDIVGIGDNCYIKATATIHDVNKKDTISSTGVARDGIKKLTKAGLDAMDAPQLTGASSTYARKTALGGLLLIDDSKDDPDKK